MVEIESRDLLAPCIDKKITLPAVLTIAGSDSSGGAGIEADLKTFSAHQVYGLTCIVALTAQNTNGVGYIFKTPKHVVQLILEHNLQDFLKEYPQSRSPLKAVKTGMLTIDAIKALSGYFDLLKEKHVKLVVDPVMMSTSGSSLFDIEGMKYCVDSLIRKSFLVTPNFKEAEILWNIKTGKKVNGDIKNIDSLVNFTVELQKLLECKCVLVKGGHLSLDFFNEATKNSASKNSQVVDTLFDPDEDKVYVFKSDRINNEDTHGTGCTLASSVAAYLAKGYPVNEAVPLSIDYIHKCMGTLATKLGHGNGPLNHNVFPAVNVNLISHKDAQEVTAIYSPGSAGDFLTYLKNHSKVRDNWQRYTHHKFLYLIATNQLHFSRFLYYLKQDYYYLLNYAQVHGLSVSVSNDHRQIGSQAFVISKIIKEIERHREKLLTNYGIDYERGTDWDPELCPGNACKAYCDYILYVGRREDYLGILVALAPCLHGYYEAGLYANQIRNHFKNKWDLGVLKRQQENDTYDSWLSDYCSDWYKESHENGVSALEQIIQKQQPLSDERLNELVDIFNRVTILEYEFWEEVIS